MSVYNVTAIKDEDFSRTFQSHVADMSVLFIAWQQISHLTRSCLEVWITANGEETAQKRHQETANSFP